jgi:hypothetical protein
MKILQINHKQWLSNGFVLSALGIAFWLINASPQWTAIFSLLNVSLWAILGFIVLFFWLSQLSLAWQFPNKVSCDYNESSYLIHFFAASLPVLLFWLLYHQVLDAWWSFDDPCILEYLHDIGPFAGFFDPAKKSSPFFYTPFQYLSLGLDYQFFLFNPYPFYWHHLLSFTLVLLLAYAVLSRFFAPLLASMIVSLFVVSVPTSQVVHHLMVRHYIEGLAFALIATWAYVQAVKQNQWGWAGFSSLFFLLACLAKELYVPLVIVLVSLPVGVIKVRLRLLLPFVIATLLYVVLRVYMLGLSNIATSYPEQSTAWQDILNFPITYFNIMGWQAIWQWFPVIGVVVVFTIAIWQKPRSLGLSSLIWFIAIFAPLIPILWRLLYINYYLLVFGFLFCIACGIAFKQVTEFLVHSSWRNTIINLWFFTLLLASLLPTQVEQVRLQKINQQEKTQGEFLLYALSPNTVLIYNYHCGANLVHLRKKVLARTEGVHHCQKEDCLCTTQYPGYTATQYINEQWQTKILSPAECENTKEDLSVVISLTPPHNVTWHFGPYPQGQGQYYVSILMTDRNAKSNAIFSPLPAQGTNTLAQPVSNPVRIVVKYVAPQGWETYSAPLLLDPAQVNDQGVVEVVWQRSLKPKTTP